MKKSLLLLGTLGVAAVATTMFVQTPVEEEGAYTPRTSSMQFNGMHQTSAQGMAEYMQLIKGDYTAEEYARIRQDWNNGASYSRANVLWYDHGPDNVGGRTRAIVIDRNDFTHIWAGSVSGGLFESRDRGNTWYKIPEMTELGISSMCQTVDGTLYIATGHDRESRPGYYNSDGSDSGKNGGNLYKMESNGNIVKIDSNYNYINEVVCDTLDNMVYYGTSDGLFTYDAVSGAVTELTNGLTGVCKSLDISPDGQIIVAAMGAQRTHVSTDGGASFVDYSSSSNTSNPIESGGNRIEYSISNVKGDNGNYYVYASHVNTAWQLRGIWLSQDNGVNWTQIAPENDGTPGSFAPFTAGGGAIGQGWYNNIIEAGFDNPEKVYLGGIDLYNWGTSGNWDQLTQWFLPPQSSNYAHADQHEMKWDKLGRLYVGNDGGIGISDDGGQSWFPANRGYNVTQFYDIGVSAHGDVAGGTQDNGTQANYHDNHTWQEHDEIGGGDGFSTEMSFINRDIVLSSVYYGAVRRTADRGGNTTNFTPIEFTTDPSVDNYLDCSPGGLSGGCGPFYTQFKLWENPNDLNSEDTIVYIPSQGYSANDTVQVPSLTSGVDIPYVTPTDIVYDDTVDYNSGLTGADSVVTTIAPSNDYNLAQFDYTITFGAHPLQAGDSVYLTALDTTIVVQSITLLDHYFGTNPLRPGKVLDMGNETQVYGIAWDTLKVQDPFQSWFAIGIGGGDGIWMTRNALRFSSNSADWFKVNDQAIGSIASMEFSTDGNHLFVGTYSGQLWRLSGFGDVYSPVREDTWNGTDTIYADTLINVNGGGTVQTTWELVQSFGSAVTDIAVTPQDIDHVVITLGEIGGGTSKVFESTSATTGTNSFSNIASGSFFSGGLPCYSAIIDREDGNVIMVGTEFGVLLTENGGTSWEKVEGDFGDVAVFDMFQNWRQFDEGCFRPGEIYIGTHGRGIWSTDYYLSLPGAQDALSIDKFIPNINVYPNPMEDQGNISFSLESDSDVTVQIFNLKGQLVTEINKNNVGAGNQNIQFGADRLTKGTYIIRLTAGDRVETSKFIKQ
jgi:hypothetical protein